MMDFTKLPEAHFQNIIFPITHKGPDIDMKIKTNCKNQSQKNCSVFAKVLHNAGKI